MSASLAVPSAALSLRPYWLALGVVAGAAALASIPVRVSLQIASAQDAGVSAEGLGAAVGGALGSEAAGAPGAAIGGMAGAALGGMAGQALGNVDIGPGPTDGMAGIGVGSGMDNGGMGGIGGGSGEGAR